MPKTKPLQPVLITVILLSNAVSLLLFILRVVGSGNIGYYFMFWNLLLAWVPVGVSYALVSQLRTHGWRTPAILALTAGWVLLLPNSFYMISDLIHLQATGDIGLLFDIVLFMSFIWNGLLAGFGSLYMVHQALVKRRGLLAHYLIAGVLLITSFAIYLGRSLHWNSWDVVANPGGLLFDVSERVINPLSYPQAVVTTTTFFLLLGSMYLVIWHIIQALRPQSSG